jgi:hypothetical protein
MFAISVRFAVSKHHGLSISVIHCLWLSVAVCHDWPDSDRYSFTDSIGLSYAQYYADIVSERLLDCQYLCDAHCDAYT